MIDVHVDGVLYGRQWSMYLFTEWIEQLVYYNCHFRKPILVFIVTCVQGSRAELGRVLRVGNLAIVDGFTKHHRKVFLFEQCIIFAKVRRTAKSGPAGTDVYDYKNSYRV